MVSAPVTWKEIEEGFHLRNFNLRNMAARVAQVGDLFAPLLLPKKRLKLERFLK